MKTLVTAIQKGGQGKTCVTCHLAFDFQEHQNLRVAVIDLDTQENASYTLSAYASTLTASMLFQDDSEKLGHALAQSVPEIENRAGEGRITLFKADAAALMAVMETKRWVDIATALRESLALIAPYFDVCLIDTPPSQGPMLAASCLAADYILSPIEMEAYSVMGVQKMSDFVQQTRRINSRLQFLGMLPNKLDSRKRLQTHHLKTLRHSFPKLVLPVSISNRASIAAALGEKKPVWKIKNAAAREASKEVRAVANYLFEKMELGTR